MKEEIYHCDACHRRIEGVPVTFVCSFSTSDVKYTQAEITVELTGELCRRCSEGGIVLAWRMPQGKESGGGNVEITRVIL